MSLPKVNEMIHSKFLRKEDIDEEIVVTVKTLSLEDMPSDGHQDSRWTLFFRELPKGLVLNTTTIRVLEKAFGPDSANWVGKKVALYVDPNVSFKGQIVGGLRVRPLKGKSPLVAAPPLATVAAPEFDDRIP
jgi:hypothetical protein